MYQIALDVADRLDHAEMDLWAAGIRGCMDASGTTARQRHLVVELTRLSHMSTIRRQGLSADIEAALARLELGLGQVDVAAQPLYSAMRDLVDHLELNGGNRWLERLRTVMGDPHRTATERLRRLGAVLDLMTAGVPGLPLGSVERVRAVSVRLPRHMTAPETSEYLEFALQPPQPSRRRDPQTT